MNIMKDSTALIKAFDLISTPGKWTKGTYARDISGEEVYPDSESAVCFCSLGALMKVTNGDCGRAKWFLYGAEHSVVDINDTADSVDDGELVEMWMTAIFVALADESV